jgi:general secretion pathway protein M
MTPKNPLRESAVLAATVVALLVPLALGGYFVYDKHRWAEERLAEVEPRHARLLGLESQRAEIGTLLAAVEESRAKFVYPAAQDAAQSGNTAQQKVRDVLTGAGLQIISSQVLPAKAEKGYDRIPLSVRAEGEMLALQNALAVLSTQLPLIIVNELDIQVLGGLGNNNPAVAPRLGAQFSLSVLRERS